MRARTYYDPCGAPVACVCRNMPLRPFHPTLCGEVPFLMALIWLLCRFALDRRSNLHSDQLHLLPAALHHQDSLPRLRNPLVSLAPLLTHCQYHPDKAHHGARADAYVGYKCEKCGCRWVHSLIVCVCICARARVWGVCVQRKTSFSAMFCS